MNTYSLLQRLSPQVITPVIWLILLLFGPAARGQQPTLRPADAVQAAKNKHIQFTATSLVKAGLKAETYPVIQQRFKQARVLDFDRKNIELTYQQKRPAISITLPVTAGKTIELELVREEIGVPGMPITTSGEGTYTGPRPIHYKGIIKGSARSFAAITIADDEIYGYMSSVETGNLTLAHIPDAAPDANTYVLYRDADRIKPAPVECHTEDIGPVPNENGYSKVTTATDKCVLVYWVASYSIYEEKGKKVKRVVDYIASLIYANNVFYQEEQINMLASAITIWSTPDPYEGLTTTSAILSAFRTDNPDFPGQIAHFINFSSDATGGRGTLPEYSGCYQTKVHAYSNVKSGNSISDPSSDLSDYTWALNVTAHEMGHNLGSAHTHACVWNGNNTPIDDCGNYYYANDNNGDTNPEYCYDPNNYTLPGSDEGTVMSYCHVLGSVGVNLALGFGQQPGDRVRYRVNNCSFFGPSPIPMLADATSHAVYFNSSYADYKVPLQQELPPTAYAVRLFARGADGGIVNLRGSCIANGGNGAQIGATWRLGSGYGKIPYGANLRMIVGGAGSSAYSNQTTAIFAAGGGGGTGILIEPPSGGDKLILIAVGGGGGGYASNFAGDCAKTSHGLHAKAYSTSGLSGEGSNSGEGGSNGSGGGAGGLTSVLSGGGGGATGDGDNIPTCDGGGKKGGQEGGAGGKIEGCGNSFDGGFGYGGGGAGKQAGSGGGGGGYSGGGGGGNEKGGGGGGSFLYTGGAYNTFYQEGGNTAYPVDGIIYYQFIHDITPPAVNCQPNITLTLGSSGTATINPLSLNNGSWDTETGIDSSSFNLDQPVLYCDDYPQKTVTLRVSDKAGNSNTCQVNVHLIDNTPPVITCKNYTAKLTAEGKVTIAASNILQQVTDNCLLDYSAPQPSLFTCANLGANTVYLSASDIQGNQSTCSSTVTVVDEIKPTMICKNAVVYLNQAGVTTLTVDQVNNNSFDNCTISSTSLSVTQLNCSHLGNNPVVLTGTDQSGNAQSCTSKVTVLDQLPPVMQCKNVTLNLNAAGVTILTTEMINNGSNDNCTLSALTASATNFNCSHLGARTVTLTGVDQSNNSATCTAIVTINDPIVPIANCKSATLALNASGTAVLAAGTVNNNSTDNCSITLSVSPNTFTCNQLGWQNVVLTVSDAAQHTATCVASVKIIDQTPPVANCINATVFLDAEGKVTITPATVNNNSTDNCSIASTTINVSQFNCSNLTGQWPVVLTVKDGSNNTSNCTAYLTVRDALPPTAICENTTVVLNANGKVTVPTSTLADGSFDNCGVFDYSPAFKIYGTANIGNNNLNITVRDFSGNAAICTAVVTVLPYGNIQSPDDRESVTDGFRRHFRLAPNPATGHTMVVLDSEHDQQVTINLLSTSGQVIYQRNAFLKAGPGSIQIDLHDIPAGLYQVRLIGDQWIEQSSLSVIKH